MRDQSSKMPSVCALTLGALLTVTPPVATAESNEHEHLAVLEIGAAPEWEISERDSHIGPAFGIEVEPVENWLEMEFGASASWSQRATNWELELPFKKPFRLSSVIEIMPGLGPTWAYTRQSGESTSTWGAEAVVDVFFWRSKSYGWFLEPSYGITLGTDSKRSAALAAGFFFIVP